MRTVVAMAARGPSVTTHAPEVPAMQPLRPDDVEVWRASLDDQPIEAVRLMHTLLSVDEVERARSFFFDRDRRRYIIGRGILRMLLSRYLGCAPHELEFTYGPNGKPTLAAGARGAGLFFNVAHSEGFALYVVTRAGEVGIDVEAIRELPEWEQVAESAFSPQELAQLRACPAERRREEFFHAWTRQEAVLKALGTGLGGATNAGAETSFKVYPLEAGPGYAAALAVSPGARRPSHVFGWETASATSFSGDATARLSLS